MVEKKLQPHLVRFLGIGMVLILLPACQSSGERGPWIHHQPPDSSNVVLRPSYEVPGTKPLYLSGYAGSNYGTIRPRRPATSSLAPILPAAPPGVTINQGTWDTE
jgi:hypothetical protein